MKRPWNIIITLLIILLMGFTILTSANNGSAIGDMVKKSVIVKQIERTVENVFKGLPPLISIE
ncbi:MAG: hypothetical protein GX359_11595 [Clostridiales bacterium]|nr:hypothetical protein [Clostridiales bacterium]